MDQLLILSMVARSVLGVLEMEEAREHRTLKKTIIGSLNIKAESPQSLKIRLFSTPAPRTQESREKWEAALVKYDLIMDLAASSDPSWKSVAPTREAWEKLIGAVYWVYCFLRDPECYSFYKEEWEEIYTKYREQKLLARVSDVRYMQNFFVCLKSADSVPADVQPTLNFLVGMWSLQLFHYYSQYTPTDLGTLQRVRRKVRDQQIAVHEPKDPQVLPTFFSDACSSGEEDPSLLKNQSNA